MNIAIISPEFPPKANRSGVATFNQNLALLLSRPWPRKHQEEQRRLARENRWEKKVDHILNILRA